jgi:hypothetical protein
MKFAQPLAEDRGPQGNTGSRTHPGHRVIVVTAVLRAYEGDDPCLEARRVHKGDDLVIAEPF